MMLLHAGVPLEYTRDLHMEDKMELLEMMQHGVAGPPADTVHAYSNYQSLHVIIEEMRAFMNMFGKSKRRYRAKKPTRFDRMYPYAANMFCLPKNDKTRHRTMGLDLLASIKQIEGIDNASRNGKSNRIQRSARSNGEDAH